MRVLTPQDIDPEIDDILLTRSSGYHDRFTSMLSLLRGRSCIGLLTALISLSIFGCKVKSNTTTPAPTQQLLATWTRTASPGATASATTMPITPTTLPTGYATNIPLLASQTSLPDVYAPIATLDHFTTIEDLQPTMIDDQHGWALGGSLIDTRHILITEDGGWTWREVTPPAMAPSGRFKTGAGAFFLDETHAWVVYYDRYLNNHTPEPVMVWMTQDGGESWTPSQPLDLSGMNGFIVARDKMIFTNPLNGWIFASVPIPPRGGDGQTTIFHTKDGGNIWQRLDFDLVGDGHLLNSIREEKFVFSSGGVGFAQVPDGLPPYILWTQDGGRRWSKIELPPPEAAPDFFEVPASSIGCLSDDSEMLPDGTALILIRCWKPEGPTLGLYRSVDFAQTWEALVVPENGIWPVLIDFLDVANGWIAGSSIYRTRDGGNTWQTIKRVGWDRFISLQFVDQQNGWAIVEEEIHKAVIASAFVRTDDGGRTWTQLVPRVINESD